MSVEPISDVDRDYWRGEAVRNGEAPQSVFLALDARLTQAEAERDAALARATEAERERDEYARQAAQAVANEVQTQAEWDLDLLKHTTQIRLERDAYRLQLERAQADVDAALADAARMRSALTAISRMDAYCGESSQRLNNRVSELVSISRAALTTDETHKTEETNHGH